MLKALGSTNPKMPVHLLFALHLWEYQGLRVKMTMPANATLLMVIPNLDFNEILKHLELQDFTVLMLPGEY